MSYEKAGDPFPVQPPPTQQPQTDVLPPPVQQLPSHVQSPPVQQPPPVQNPPPYAYPGQSQPPLNQFYPGPMYAPQQQQQQQSNVVVVTAQPTQPAVVVTHQPHAPDYMTLTIIGFIICFFCGGILGMVLLVPALICSVMAQNANSSGDYEGAKKLGRASLGWNIATYILYTLFVIALVIGIVVQTVTVTSRTITSTSIG